MMLKSSGIVLLMVLGVLTILSLMGVTFLVLARGEQVIARNYTDEIRAKFLAQSGVEMAVAKLSSLSLPQFYQSVSEWLYLGEDFNRNGQLDPGEDQNENGELDTHSCPLALALAPSFFHDSVQIYQRRLTLNKGISGFTTGSYEPKGDIYSLKIVDTSSQIYLNDNQTNLKRILNNLGKILGLGDDLGETIIKAREQLPQKKFTAKEELIEIIGKEAYKKLEPFVTVWGWVDPKVIKPKPLSERIRYQHPKTKLVSQVSLDKPVYGWDELNPISLEFEPRAPVNINTAPKEVLISLLLDLAGWYLDESPLTGFSLHYSWANAQASYREGWIAENQPYTLDHTTQKRFKLSYTPLRTLNAWLGSLKASKPIDLEEAQQIAQAIIEERLKTPFSDWQSFNEFVDEKLVKTGIIDKIQGDVLKANFNPNTDLNDFNPDAILYKDVDKSDLLVYSTEFCFLPTGYFEIESEGLVTYRGKVMASRSIKTVVQLWSIYRETTQKDFSRGVISENKGPYGTHQDQTLVTYPEPNIKGYPGKAEYDGQIMLATIESPQKEAILYVNFRDSLDAVRGAQCKHIPDLQGPYVNSLLDLSDSPNPAKFHPGNLYPDGCYSERYSSIIYPASGNINLPTGGAGVSFWLKPNFYPEKAWKIRNFFSLSKWGGETKPTACIQQDPKEHGDHNLPDRRNCIFGLFFIPAHDSPPTLKYHSYEDLGNRTSSSPFPPRSLGFGWARFRFGQAAGSVTPCLNYTGFRGNYPPNILSAHQWIHIGITWETDLSTTVTKGIGPDKSGSARIELYLNGVNMGTQFGPSKYCIFGYGSTVETFLEGNFLRFGELSDVSRLFGKVISISNFSADATIDEINTYTDTSVAPIINQFEEGRYYREDDATFISGEIELPKQSRLKGVAFTQYLPRSLPDPRLEVQISLDNGASWHEEIISPGGSEIDLPVEDSIKYKVVFKTGAGLNEPLLESPVLNDVTIYYSIKPCFVSWFRPNRGPLGAMLSPKDSEEFHKRFSSPPASPR